MNVIPGVHVSLVVLMAVLAVQTLFAFAGIILLQGMKTISNLVLSRIVLIWDNVFLIVMKMELVKVAASKISRTNIKTVHARYSFAPCPFPRLIDLSIFKSKCPLGCPCDAFDCEPDQKSILVLNTQSSNKPVLIKYDGGEQKNFDFTMGPGTSVYFSCSAKLNGDFYIFGGFGNDNRQVSG